MSSPAPPDSRVELLRLCCVISIGTQFRVILDGTKSGHLQRRKVKSSFLSIHNEVTTALSFSAGMMLC